jgi:hypothetical protein
MKQVLLAFLGAAAGGVLGYCVFFWMARQGFYALALPGGLLGLGAGITKTRTILVAIICGLAAAVLGLVAEWRFAPFADNDGFAYFLAHVHSLSPVTLGLILVGTAIAFWIPYRRMERKQQETT